MSTIKHFETLWEEAEAVALQLTQKENKSSLIVLEDIKKSVLGLIKLNTVSDSQQITDELKAAFKRKKLGELVFLIANLSKIENINVYAELQSEINIRQIELLSQIPESE